MSEIIERDGHVFTRRNLDEERLTSKEATLQERMTRHDSLIDTRIHDVLTGEANPALPIEVSRARGLTKVEKDITRQAMLDIVRIEALRIEGFYNEYITK